MYFALQKCCCQKPKTLWTFKYPQISTFTVSCIKRTATTKCISKITADKDPVLIL